jgi:hypothetical protein
MKLSIIMDNGRPMTIEGVTSFQVEGTDENYVDNTPRTFETVRRAINSTNEPINIPVNNN